MAVEIDLLDSGSSEDAVDAKYAAVDVLETGEKSLESSTLESFNKKARSLAAGILTTDDDENVEDFPDYNSTFMDEEDDDGIGLVSLSDISEMSDGDNGSGSSDSNDSDEDNIDMSDSDTLLED